MAKRTGKLVVKRSVTGLGLFTLEPIPAGTRIIEFVGRLITGEEAEVKGGKYLFEVNENCYIDGSARSNLARYLNHSCGPNAAAHISGKRIWIWSRRAIRAGEEITFNYGKAFVEEYLASQGTECKCAKCTPASKAVKSSRR
jgi:SET domain-containing protein